MEVKIISKECIKPCSPTPSHLKTFKISLLDQFLAPIFYSTTLFYPNTNNNLVSRRSHFLKQSLSEILSGFYPLAGKIKDRYSIDCNDEGVHYIEASANIPLTEYLTNLDLKLLYKLVPDTSPFFGNPIGAFIVMIQETSFACGGLAIGFSVCHIILDGTAFASFIKAWALAASSLGAHITNPNLDAPKVFPHHEPFPKEAMFASLRSQFFKKQKVLTTRLVFDGPAIEKLKEKAKSNSVEKPSRVEVVSAVICKSVMATFNAPLSIMHAVNLRRKATPPFPDCSIGNFLWLAPTTFTENKSEISTLVYKIRSSIRKVDNDFVKKIESSKLLEEIKLIQSQMNKGKELMSFTSWCNFGVYKNSDFGWGNPIWNAHCYKIDSEKITTFGNVCILNDTISGDGIEAWVYLPQDVAALLEKDGELLQYASINPSPLGIPDSHCSVMDLKDREQARVLST